MCKRGSIERDGKWVDRVEGMGFARLCINLIVSGLIIYSFFVFSSRAAMVDVTVDAEAQKRGISVFQVSPTYLQT